jgi:hypothetical protein
MRTLIPVVLALACVASGRVSGEYDGSVGYGHGIELPNSDPIPCPHASLVLNFDGSAENGYCWQYGGILPPFYGAFAECGDFGAGKTICGIELLLTGLGHPRIPCDLYVWADGGGLPGNVLSMTPAVDPGEVPLWPSVRAHNLPIAETRVEGVAWFGYWANYNHRPCGYFIAADTNGIGGCPYTNVAPGIGYPTGWNAVGVVWGPTQSIAIGAWCRNEPVGGACCVYGDCRVCADTTCARNGGTFLGNGIACDPDPCSPTSEVGSGPRTVDPDGAGAVPNPSAGPVRIEYRVRDAGRVSLQIYDAAGSRVRTLVDSSQPAGRPVACWDGRDDAGAISAPGVYLIRIATATEVTTRKVVLAR